VGSTPNQEARMASSDYVPIVACAVFCLLWLIFIMRERQWLRFLMPAHKFGVKRMEWVKLNERYQAQVSNRKQEFSALAIPQESRQVALNHLDKSAKAFKRGDLHAASLQWDHANHYHPDPTKKEHLSDGMITTENMLQFSRAWRRSATKTYKRDFLDIMTPGSPNSVGRGRRAELLSLILFSEVMLAPVIVRDLLRLSVWYICLLATLAMLLRFVILPEWKPRWSLQNRP
jgi:hypothetical protein